MWYVDAAFGVSVLVGVPFLASAGLWSYRHYGWSLCVGSIPFLMSGLLAALLDRRGVISARSLPDGMAWYVALIQSDPILPAVLSLLGALFLLCGLLAWLVVPTHPHRH